MAPRLCDLTGLWRRSLIVQPDGSRDETTWVHWLQGPTDYADLRQPPGRPDFSGVKCLRELTQAHLGWMAAQDGFAGRLSVSAGVFEWRRDIDFQPPGPTPDRGWLSRNGDVLIEDGYHAPYVEHWHRASETHAPAYALRLREDGGGRDGRLIRVGAFFMYARARSAHLSDRPNLQACIQMAGSLAEAQDMADCEISFGVVTGRDWLIEKSSLAFKEGRNLDIRPAAVSGHIEIMDFTPDGREITRQWHITAREGDCA
jgi:hypothetical protein